MPKGSDWLPRLRLRLCSISKLWSKAGGFPTPQANPSTSRRSHARSVRGNWLLIALNASAWERSVHVVLAVTAGEFIVPSAAVPALPGRRRRERITSSRVYTGTDETRATNRPQFPHYGTPRTRWSVGVHGARGSRRRGLDVPLG